tara:strand:- start:109 stop:345 length:237 start_codon:yes stop_codon:yes gene_type:complete
MSAGEERVNTESQQQEQAPRTVSATAVLLSAVELAQTRGAYKMNEMSLITQAYNMVLSQEQQKNAAVAAQSNEEESTE